MAHAVKAKKGGKSSKGKSKVSAGTTVGGSAGGAVGGVCDVAAGSSVEELLAAGSAAFGRDYAASEKCYRLVLEKDKKNVLAVYNIGLGQMNQVAATASCRSTSHPDHTPSASSFECSAQTIVSCCQ